MADLTDRTHEQVRQFVDAEQVFAAYRAARIELAQRFAGSMAWKTVRGHQYLYRKRKADWSSLVPRHLSFDDPALGAIPRPFARPGRRDLPTPGEAEGSIEPDR
ncbi:hypothetical protein [Methylobacterium frigidaeris]|uniref:Uncharacterized protein n=1 Tax=Methylobacterium frigidaeris TaxID=2038277 RepID=A0AA37M3M3_9HYPH|nr:hypothetical protein [Methylobacterium frigidaeris]PIK74727.1 hypothetical protein CS379_00925 [Methylobacterium frigidaeris]GJD60969.1 hypothetical protein MPEAHAMD_1109 [Methylobacterium frigidaeris]